MIYPHLNGKHYLCLVRCSGAHQVDTSIPDQQRLLRAFGDENGMTFVADMILDGVTGSVPGARHDIEEIIFRKLEINDFEVLLVQDVSRLTRGGPEHGMKIEFDLRAAGIELVFAAENLPQGDHAGIIKSVGLYAAKQHAKAISFAVSRGSMSALQQDRTTHCSTPPYGIDRLIIDNDGKPLHALRNLPNGSQQKLDPQTGALLATFGRNGGQGKSNHYRRQPNERAMLVPGSPESITTVRDIFKWSLIDGWGHWRIAQTLNSRGISPAKGGSWSTSSISGILKNPVYSGRGIANRYSCAIYNRRSANAPTAANVDPMVLATRKAPQQIVRPRQDWFEDEHPLLRNYLDAPLRDLAVAKQTQVLDAQGKGRTPIFSRDRHTDSRYILKGLLKAKQGAFEMTGRTVGPKGRRVRYYAISRAYHAPTDPLLRRTVRADAIERAVIEAVKEVLTNLDDLRDQVRSAVAAHIVVEKQDAAELEGLNRQREELRGALEFVIDSLGDLGKELAKKKIVQLEAELAALESRIVRAKATDANVLDVNSVVEAIVQRLADLQRSFEKMPSANLRKLLASLVSRLEVDLETKAIELELSLPLRSALANGAGTDVLCLDGSPAYQSANEAQHNAAMKLALFRCHEKPRANRREPTCLQCQRRKSAA